ncbi:MAG TPA: VanW family protein [Candidatus Limnocylindria bacterium]
MTSSSVATRLRFVPAAFRTRRGFTLGFLATLLVGLMLLVGASVGVAVSHGDRIMPGVAIGGVSVGGMDRTAAGARLEAQLPSLSAGTLTLDVDGHVSSVPLGDLGRHYDIDATLDIAYGVARSGNPLADGLGRLRTMVGPTAAGEAVVAADHGAIEELVSSITQRFNREPKDATIRRAGPSFVAVPAVTGLTVDPDALRNSLEQILAGTGRDLQLDALVTRRDPLVSSDQATEAARAASQVTAQPLILRGAGRKLSLSRAQLTNVVSFGTIDGGWGMTLDPDAVEALLKPIGKQLASSPTNARYTWGASGISGVIPAQPGRKLKIDASLANVTAALQARASGASAPSATLAVGVAKPNLTTAAARAAMPKMRVLGTWTTYYVPGEGNFNGANISIPAQDINGQMLAPGEWFDFWRGIGPITTARGYGYGGAIIGGRSVANGALAGGICSTSTTLFNAAMRSGLQIGDKTNHYYYIDRYPMGLDATVFQTDTYEVNMTFRNDTANPIVIRSYTGFGFVRFDVWGVPDGRSVSLSTPVKSNYRTARETTVFNPNLPPGTAIRREYMHDGFDTSVTRWVRDAKGNIIHQDTWYSHYSVVNGVTEVGPKRT